MCGKVIFLGTGTSSGVPKLGCNCKVCTSQDQRDRRRRSSILIETKGKRILVDCGPDFYSQILPYTFAPIDAVLITHEHYDHVGGLDDLRPFCSEDHPMNIYAENRTADNLIKRIPYCFYDHANIVHQDESDEIPPKIWLPHFKMNIVCLHENFYVGDVKITPIRVMHGSLPIFGWRIDDLIYITDMKTMPGKELKYFYGAKVLIENALQFESHPTHQNLEEAVEFSSKTKIKKTYLTHMGHGIGLHSSTSKTLPEGIELAYDGLEISV